MVIGLCFQNFTVCAKLTWYSYLLRLHRAPGPRIRCHWPLSLLPRLSVQLSVRFERRH